MSTTVSNLTSPRSGEPVKNQFIITIKNLQSGDCDIFQSYRTAIAKNHGGVFTISGNYNYSTTTNRYFGQWLRSYGLDTEDIAQVRQWLKTAKHGNTDASRSRFTLIYVDSL